MFKTKKWPIKQFLFKRFAKLILDQSVLKNFILIYLNVDFKYELSISSFRVVLYLLQILTISKFLCLISNFGLTTYFLSIHKIQFFCKKSNMTQVFPRLIYAFIYKIVSICGILLSISLLVSLFEQKDQIEFRFLQAANSNYANRTLDLWLQ